jgi:hypothetical protein
MQDYGYAQQMFELELQPANDYVGVRILRSLEPIVAALNAARGTNFVVCESRKELGALVDSISKKTGCWQGGAITLVDGSQQHFIAVHINARPDRVFLDAFDSLHPEAYGSEATYKEYKKLVLARPGITARYSTIPVQIKPKDCAAHAMHFLMAGGDEVAKRLAGESEYAPSVESTVKTANVCQAAELAIHVDSLHMLNYLRRTAIASNPLPEWQTGRVHMSLQSYFDAHQTTKRNAVKRRDYTYSDSSERFWMSLLEDAIHWAKNTPPEKMLSQLQRARPHNLGNHFGRKYAIFLPDTALPDAVSFRDLPRHANSKAAFLWNPELYLKNTELPAMPGKAHMLEWLKRM